MDDFSFPTLAVDPDALCQLPFPHFASSPLWFLASVSQHEAPCQRRSFCSTEDAYGVNLTDDDGLGCPSRHLSSPALSDDGNSGRFLENEKMDMLWEDFNEDLARLSYQTRQASDKSRRDAASVPAFHHRGGGSRSRKGSREAKVDLREGPALGMPMSKSSSVIHHRRPSMATMLKQLKRFFPLHNPRSSRKTRHCDEQDTLAS